MLIKIIATYNNKKYCLSAEDGETVSKILRRHKLLQLPCGGAGTCGKCLIHADTVPHAEEIKRLSPAALTNGLRLACYTVAYEGLRVKIPHQNAARVLTAFSTVNYDFHPIVEKTGFPIQKATLENQKSDIKNLVEMAGAKGHQLSIRQQAQIPEFLLLNDYGYGLLQDGELLSYSADSAHTLLSVDIGTTTVAGTLTDLRTQAIIGVCGELNDQSPFGADVISRIHNSIEGNSDGAAALQKAIADQITRIKNSLVSSAAKKGMDISDPSIIAVTGNTTMIHFLCELPTENIGKAPFIPVSLEPMRLPACDLHIGSKAPVYIMPGISAYVGPDIVAALLAANAHQSSEPFLLVDFGTNAEIVLSDGDNFFACSTAAGPCFEGATLSCGSVAEPGAIDTVFHSTEGLAHTTIDQLPAKSICGSAVIDCIAELLNVGVIEESGRLNEEGPFSDRINMKGEEKIFAISDAVYLSQGDIRKVQLAKAAVRAGIEILLQKAGISAQQIKTLFIAGGFGAAMNPQNAIRIGMLPKEMEGAIRTIGNAAGSGVMRYVTEHGAVTAVTGIIKKTTYFELSSDPEFTNEYVMQMTFPEPERKFEVVNF